MSKRFTGMDFKPRNPNGRSPVSRTGQRPEIGLPGVRFSSDVQGGRLWKGKLLATNKFLWRWGGKNGQQQKFEAWLDLFFGLWDGSPRTLWWKQWPGLSNLELKSSDDPIFHFEASHVRFRGMFVGGYMLVTDKKTWVARDSTGKNAGSFDTRKDGLDLGPPPLDFGYKGWSPFIQRKKKLVVLGFTFSPSWKRWCKENTSQHLPF